MKKTIATILVAMVTLVFAGAAISANSLRGGQAIDDNAKAPAKSKQKLAEGGIERSYKIQPPSIPHKIDKERINLKVNTCMKCHSAATYEKEKAPKAGDTHYMTRDGKKTEKVAARRYFCNQCHSLQLDMSPMVENTFQGFK